MTFLWMDGFEADRTVAAFSRRYEGVVGLSSSPIGTLGRNGGFCFENQALATLFRTPALGAASTSAFIGFHFWAEDVIAGADVQLLNATFVDASNQVQCELIFWSVAGTNRFEIAVRSGGEVYRTTDEYETGQWFFVEFKAVIETAFGSPEWELRIQNTVVATGSGSSLALTGTDGWSKVDFGMSSALGAVRIDDLYILDGSLVFPYDFLGPGVVETLHPLADAEANEWDLASTLPIVLGASHANHVDEGRTQFESDDDVTRLEEDGSAGEKREVFQYSRTTRIRGSIFGLQAAVDVKQVVSVSSSMSQGAFYLLGYWWGSPFSPAVSANYNRAWACAGYNIPLGLPWNTETLKDSHFGFRKEP